MTRYKNSNYLVYRNGRVYSESSETYLKGFKNAIGYIYFDLWIRGKRTRIALHQLLAICYIPNPNKLPLVRHLNDNVSDNRIINLAWGNKSDNMIDALKNGKWKNINYKYKIGEENNKSVLIKRDVISIRKDKLNGMRCIDIVNKYGVSRSTIWRVCSKRNWKHV